MIELIISLVMQHIQPHVYAAAHYPPEIEKPFIALETDGRYIESPQEKEKTLQDLVAEEFGYGSIMWWVCKCESNFRQFEKDGTVLKSYYGTNDVGLFQIHVPVWGKEAEKLGYDIYSPEGNIKMARHILNTQGINAWLPSKPCWSKM